MNLLVSIVGGTVGAAFVSGIFGVIMWKLNRKATCDDRKTDVIVGLQLLLYIQIKQLGLEYISANEIQPGDLEDLDRMHKFYHDNLDGDGYLDGIMNKVRRLPLRIA